jgi:hypothetical protein
MTTRQGQPTSAAAKRAKAMANSLEVNRHRREPPVIDWEERIANLLDILDDIYERRG